MNTAKEERDGPIAKIICPECGCLVKSIALAAERERAEKAEASGAALAAALKEAMEWNWLDEEADPPKEVVVRINLALANAP